MSTVPPPAVPNATPEPVAADRTARPPAAESRQARPGARSPDADDLHGVRTISAAVGMLAQRHGVGIDQAYAALRLDARSQRERLEVAAARVLEAHRRVIAAAETGQAVATAAAAWPRVRPAVLAATAGGAPAS